MNRFKAKYIIYLYERQNLPFNEIGKRYLHRYKFRYKKYEDIGECSSSYGESLYKIAKRVLNKPCILTLFN